MSQQNQWLGSDDQGDRGTPGQEFSKMFAGVKRAKNGQYELHVRSVWGSNQGYLEEHGREERKFRADTLDELLRVGISEIRGDEAFESPKFAQAVRNAIYEAQDAEADSPKTDTAYALRCNRGPSEGLWWTGGGWGRESERVTYATAEEARREADDNLDPSIVADVVSVCVES